MSDQEQPATTQFGRDRLVDWETGRAANLANWEDRAPLHAEAYGLDAYRDPERISQVVGDDLPLLCRFLPGCSISGLDVCHLQCHIGNDTVSLLRSGARSVTGVDFSPTALDIASRFAAGLGHEINWVCSDVLDAAAAVDEQFDVVYTSIGTICWLADLQRWAAQIAELLRPGGVFYIRDGHPMLYTLDETRDELVCTYRYFNDGTAQVFDYDNTYVGDGKVAHPRTYEWVHPLSEIFGAILGAGLQVLAFDEGRTLPWRFAGTMVGAGENYAYPAPLDLVVPTTFTLVARKPPVFDP